MAAQVVAIDDSSHVREIQWDPGTGVLEVLYRQGRRYRYHAVPAETWEQLMRAPSKGSFLRRVIHPSHRVQEVS